MSFTKTVCALFLSVLLMAAQTVFALQTGATPVEKKKTCCCCTQMRCCSPTAPTPAPQPQPAQNSRTTTQTQAQFVAVVITLLPKWPAKRAVVIPASPSLALTSTDVPLFTRNCSYLI